MELTNVLGLPQALVDAVANDPYSNGGAWRSVTQLISPPRAVVLKKRHEHEIKEDVADRLFSLYGQIVHGILERANSTDRVEERLFLEVEGRKISGQFDTLHVQSGTLSDWKFSTVWKALGPSDEWTVQMNLLALLLRANGTEVKDLEIVLLMRDHSKLKAKRESDYPQLPVARLPIMMWSNAQQEAYLQERIRVHAAAEESLPECSPAERWQKQTTYAVMKAGRKSAVKLYDEKEYADAHAKLDEKALSVVERPGENVRCDNYCSASQFCSFYKTLKQKHDIISQA